MHMRIVSRFGMLVGVVALALGGVSCEVLERVRGSGRIVSERRAVTGFDGVSVRGSGKLTIRQTGTESLVIEADDNIVPLIETQVQNGRLVIRPKHNKSLSPSQPIRYLLTVKELRAISCRGSAEIHAQDIATDRLEVTVSGSGEIDAQGIATDQLEVAVSGSGEIDAQGIATDQLAVTVSGSGEIRMSGTTEVQHVRISGSGEYLAEELHSRQAQITVSGSGDAAVRVSDKLDVNVSGSGSVTYLGNPAVTQSIRGSGSVTHRPETP